MASRGARLLPRGLDPVHRRGGVVVALAGLGPVGRRGHLADGDGHDALGIPHGERIVREILAEADLDVLVRTMVFLANRHEAGGPLDAEPLELLDDRVVLGPGARAGTARGPAPACRTTRTCRPTWRSRRCRAWPRPSS